MGDERVLRMAEALKAACAAVAGHCDGAIDDDGVGFNKADTSFGRYIAAVPASEWTEEVCAAVSDMLRKYQGQLTDNGIDYAALPRTEIVWERKAATSDMKEKAETVAVREAVEAVRSGLKMRGEVVKTYTKRMIATRNADGSFDLFSPRRQDLIDAIKALPYRSRKWTGTCWNVSGEGLSGLSAIIERFGFIVAEADLAALRAQGEVEAKREAERKAAESRVQHITIENDRIVARTPYNPEAVAEMQRIQGRRWDGERKLNTFPVEIVAAERVLALCARYGYKMSDETRAALVGLGKAAAERVEASQAADADLVVEGFGGETLKLRPFQAAGIKYAIETKRTFIGDAMGLGKTIQALGSVQATGNYPALIVVPKAVKLQWAGEVHRWVPGKSVLVVSGTTPLDDYKSDVVLVNYDVVGSHLEGLRKVDFKSLVLDEAHYCKSRKSLRSQACVTLSKLPGLNLVLCLTGTPVLNRPIELVNQLDILGRLNDLGGFWGFAKRYCDARQTKYGWDMTGASNLDELSKRLRATCFVRREKADVAKELPPIQRTTVPMELDDRAAYKEMESNISSWVEAKREERIEALKNGEEWDTNSYNAEALVRIEALKQLTVKHKLAACIEWTKNFLDSDGKLVLFAHHRDIQAKLLVALAEYNPARISGDQSDESRDAEVKKFWNDETCKVMVASLKAGNVGINLQVSSSVAFVEFGWTSADHDQAEARCHRIGTTASSVNSYWLAAEGTFDDRILEIIEDKRAIVDAINAGHEVEKISVLKDAIAWFEKRSV